ncbi:MAG: hypothetical protein WKF59_06870 [Chitinophagaceae bacterium]
MITISLGSKAFKLYIAPSNPKTGQFLLRRRWRDLWTLIVENYFQNQNEKNFAMHVHRHLYATSRLIQNPA